MKIVCVLMVLATLFGHSKGAVTSCKQKADLGSGLTPGEVTLTDQGCTLNVDDSLCSRPKLVAGAYLTDGAKWGCGECGTAENCVTCVADNCNIDAVTCWSNEAQGANDVEQCTGTELQCKRPKVNSAGDFTGNDDNWGCGACSAEDNCVNCDSPGDQCNVKTEKGDTHTCLNYKQGESAWVRDTDSAKVTCHTEGGAGCKMPAKGYAEDNFDECGSTCPENTEETCRGCDADDCNDRDSADVFMCKKGDGDADITLESPSVFCTDSCTRPAVAYGTVVDDTVGYGCGDCENVDDCVPCTEKNCNVSPTAENSHKCFDWEWDASTKWTAGDLKDCQAGEGEQKCSMPKKATAEQLVTDLVAGLTGCGPCAADQSETCTTTAPEQNKEGTHQCHTWEWKSADNEWEYSKATINCYTGTSEETKKCSLPKDRSKETGFVATGACSKCGTDTTANANCMDSAPGENSGPRVLFSLLALALPIFYALL